MKKWHVYQIFGLMRKKKKEIGLSNSASKSASVFIQAFIARNARWCHDTTFIICRKRLGGVIRDTIQNFSKL